MKTQNSIQTIILIILSLFLKNDIVFAAEYNINQPSGTISVWGNNYVDNMNETWNVNIGTNKVIRLECSGYLDYRDYVFIYEVDNNGKTNLIETFNYYFEKTITTSVPNGKVKIVFISDFEVSWQESYDGFKINFSAEESNVIEEDVVFLGNVFVNGNLGIGTMNPRQALEINGAIQSPLTIKYNEDNYVTINSGSANRRIYFTSSNFPFLFDKQVQVETGELSSYGTTQNLFLQTHSTTRMTILASNGYVGINTTNPQYQLDIKGDIRATGVKVQSVDKFPDYVFENAYPLLSLEEVNIFIKNNGHLPGIPTATEAKEEGIDMVEMQVKLLEKIEELTLHLIRQEEKIKELESKIK